MSDIIYGVKMTLEDEITNGLSNIQNKTGSVFTKMGSSIKSFLTSKFGFAAISAAIYISIKDFAEFEKKMIDVGNNFNATEKDVKTLSKAVLQMSKEIPVSAQDLANGLYDVVSAGIAVADSMDVLAVAAKLAVSGVTTTEIAVDGLTSIINAYGYTAKDATMIADKFFAANVLGKTTIGELSSAIGTVSSVSKNAGISFDEMMTSVAILTKATGNTGESVTALRAAIIAVSSPTDSAKIAFNSLGIAYGDAALKGRTLGDVFKEIYDKTGGNLELIRKLIPEIRGMNAVLLLGGAQSKELAAGLQYTSTASDMMSDAFIKQSKSMSSQLILMKNDWKSFTAHLVEKSNPALTWFISQTRASMNAVSVWAKEIDWLIKKLNALASGKQSQSWSDFYKSLEEDGKKSMDKDLENLKSYYAKQLKMQSAATSNAQLNSNTRTTIDAQEMLKKIQNAETGKAADARISEEMYLDFEKRLQAKKEKQYVSAQEEILLLEDMLKNHTIINDERKKLDQELSDAKKRLNEEDFLNQQRIFKAIKDEWKVTYDDQKSVFENFAEAFKGIWKSMVIDYLRGLEQRVAAETAAGIASAIASKNWPAAGVIAIQGAAAVTAIEASIAGISGLKTGGIVTKPGMYEVGEQNRKEAVIPLESESGRRLLGASNINTNNDYSQNITLQIDGVKLAEIITNKQAMAQRTGRF